VLEEGRQLEPLLQALFLQLAFYSGWPAVASEPAALFVPPLQAAA